MIDYGHDGTRKDLSLRAYRRHQLVNPLENPGEHDITADVNFGYLKSLIEDRALIFGPIDQRLVIIFALIYELFVSIIWLFVSAINERNCLQDGKICEKIIFCFVYLFFQHYLNF